MLDLIGATASFVTLIEISSRIITKAYRHISKIKDANHRFHELLVEVSATNAILVELHSTLIALDYNCSRDIIKLIEQPAISRFTLKLTELETRLELHGPNSFLRRLAWPVAESHVNDQLRAIREFRNLTSTLLAAAAAKVTARIENAVNNIQHNLDSMRLLDWLCPLNVTTDDGFQNALQLQHKGSGRWLLRSKSYIEWSAGRASCLWLTGPSGCGKTVYSAAVINALLGASQPKGYRWALLYCFIDYKNPNKTTFDFVLQTLIRQAVRQHDQGLEAVRTLSNLELQHRPTTAALQRILVDVLSAFCRTFIVIDAPEDLEEPSDIELMYETLEILMNRLADKVKLFISSRQCSEVENFIRSCTLSSVVVVNDRNQDDIRHFVMSKAAILSSKHRRMSLELRDDMLTTVTERASGNFLIAELSIRRLLQCRSILELKEAVADSPSGLEETYEKAFVRILQKNACDKDRVLLRRMVLVLCESTFCLPVTTFAAFLAIAPEDTEVNMHAIASNPTELCDMLQGLLRVDYSVSPPEVALAHPTIETYLHSRRCENSGRPSLFVNRVDAQPALTETCLQYLSFRNFQKPLLPSPGSKNIFKKYPGGIGIPFTPSEHSVAMESRLEYYEFLYYSSHCWPEHFRRSKYRSLDQNILSRLQWFLHDRTTGGQYQSWQEAHAFFCSSHLCDCDFWQPPLYFAIAFGLESIVRHLLPGYRTRLAQPFAGDRLPIDVAFRHGQLGVAKILQSAMVAAGLTCPSNCLSEKYANSAVQGVTEELKNIAPKECLEKEQCSRCNRRFPLMARPSAEEPTVLVRDQSRECLRCINVRWDPDTSNSEMLHNVRERCEKLRSELPEQAS